MAEPSEIDISDSLAYVVHRTARLLRVHFLRAGEAVDIDLTPEQWFILNKLRRREGQSQSELTDAIFSDRPNLTRIINVLERRGLVVRRGHPVDGRTKLVFLTKQGQKLHDRFAHEVVAKERDRLFSGIAEEDIAAARRVLVGLEEALQ